MHWKKRLAEKQAAEGTAEVVKTEPAIFPPKKAPKAASEK